MIKIYVYESVWCSICYTLVHLFRSRHGRQIKILLFSTFVFQEGHIQLEERMPKLSSRITLRARVCALCGPRGTVWHLNNGLIQVELLSLIFLSPTNNPPFFWGEERDGWASSVYSPDWNDSHLACNRGEMIKSLVRRKPHKPLK